MVSLLLKMWLPGSVDIRKDGGWELRIVVTSTRFGTVWRRQKFINLITNRERERNAANSQTIFSYSAIVYYGSLQYRYIGSRI